MTKFYKIITTIFYSLISFVVVCALTLQVSAQSIYVPFSGVYAVSNGWTVDLGLTLNQVSTSSNVINPFREITNNQGQQITPITQTYEYYGQALFVDDSSTTPYSSVGLATGNIGYTGAVNTISIDMAMPVIGDRLSYFNSITWSITIGSQVYKPDRLNIVLSDPIINGAMIGAPVSDLSFYCARIMVYFDQPLTLSTSSYIQMSLPVNGYNFTDYSITTGCVFGYDSFELEYYSSLAEAQNAKIIDLIEDSGNSYHYEEILGDLDEEIDRADSIVSIEEDFYSAADEVIPDQLDSEAQVIVDDFWSEMGFIWHPWIVKVIIAVIPISVLSYAMFGKG